MNTEVSRGQVAPRGESERAKVATQEALNQIRAALHHPAAVALAILLIYGASCWLGFGLQKQDPLALATLGVQFITQGGNSSPTIIASIAAHAHLLTFSNTGYDGQFSYYIAMDPLHAAPYIDDPSLRYARILYPLAAWALGFGNPDLIPYTLVIVNMLAMAFGSLGVAVWLQRRGLSPWLALVYGLFPGFFDAFRHDLTEPLAYALVVWGIVALGWRNPTQRYVGATIFFALALLGREETIFISLPYILRLAWPEISAWRWPAIAPGLVRAAGVLVGSVGPYLIWKGALYFKFGSVIQDAGQYLPFRAPFAGLLTYWSATTTQEIEYQVYFVAIPGLIVTIAAIVALVQSYRTRAGWKPATFALLINALYLCVFLAPQSYLNYLSAGRIQCGVVLAALLALPIFDRVWNERRGWFWASQALWLMPLWLIGVFPLINGYLVYWHILPA